MCLTAEHGSFRRDFEDAEAKLWCEPQLVAQVHPAFVGQVQHFIIENRKGEFFQRDVFSPGGQYRCGQEILGLCSCHTLQSGTFETNTVTPMVPCDAFLCEMKFHYVMNSFPFW